MRKNLKISYGGIIKKVVATLGLTALIITLGSMYSCSSDGEYEEPWLNKEHRTRAAILTTRYEAPSEQMIEEGYQVVTLDIKPKCSVELHWTTGYMTGSNSPKSTVTAENPVVLSPNFGHAFLDECILQWNSTACRIEGTINIHGTYTPYHTSKVLSFRKRFIHISEAVTPTFMGDDSQAVNDTIQAECEELDTGFISTNVLFNK